MSQKNIPNSWQEKKFADVFKIGSGKDYKHLGHGDVPVFGTGGYMLSVDDFLYSGKTVFIGRKGTINKPFYYKGKFWTVDTLFYTYDFKDTTAEFVNLVFQKIQWKKYNEASGVPSLSKTTIEKIKFIFPPLPEQNAIVAILETWDKYLEKLSRKIEIKKGIKKGVASQIMNCELLIVNGEKVYAPKLRLSGFSGEWESVKLGDVVEYKNGGSFEKFVIKNGKYFLITLNSIDINGKLKKDHKRVDKADWYLKKGDLIMVLSDIAHGYFLGLVDKIPVNDKYVLNQRMGLLRGKTNSIDIDFIRMYLNVHRKYFKMHGQGSSQQNLSKGDILKFKFRLPNIKEQTVNAKILTTADKEIEALEKRKRIVGEQKRFLLNNLVTGKIRV